MGSATGPKAMCSISDDLETINCEPKKKKAFSLYELVISGICYTNGKLTNTYGIFLD
jgi:hypothetical protein